MNELYEYLELAVSRGSLTSREARDILDDHAKYGETTVAIARLVDRFGRRCEG